VPARTNALDTMPVTGPYREPTFRIPRQPLPISWLVGLLACALLAAYTSHKLVYMARLRGWLEGAPERTYRVLSDYRMLGAATYVIDLQALDGDAARCTLQVRQADWVVLREGSTVRARRVPGERECFVPQSVYIEDGNVQFDAGLLSLEAVGVVGCAWGAWRRRPRRN
jgi:hypothetical protein